MFFLKELPSNAMIDRYVMKTGNGNTHDIRSGLAMMRNASLLLRKIETHLSKYGISQLKFIILVAIDREPDRISLRQSEIAQRIDVSKPVLNRTIRALLADGLLIARKDKDDRRVIPLSLTKSAEELLDNIFPEYFETIITFMEETR